MKKYQLGTLTVNDKCLQDTKEEIVIYWQQVLKFELARRAKQQN